MQPPRTPPQHRGSALCLALISMSLLLVGAPASGQARSSSIQPPEAPSESTTFASVNRPWTAPLTGHLRIIRGFEPASSRWGRGHRGVDLAARPGTAVRSAGSGVVVFARRLANRGVVSVEHAPGVRTTYEPVRAEVAVGSMVSAGTLLGYVTVGGHQPGALHWGLRIRDSYADPLRLLRGTSVLKPIVRGIMRADEPA